MNSMSRIAGSLALAALAAAFTAAAARESRPVGDFTGIGVSAPVNVLVVQGDASRLELDGPEDALARIETVVEDGRLTIRVRDGRSAPWRGKVDVRVTARRIQTLSISGSGDIVAPSLTGDSLKVSISGSGDVRLGGRVEGLTASIAGSGDIRAADLDARRVKISIAGSGDATVRAREALTVSVAGSGDVRYYGDPAVEKSVLGSGRVKRIGAAAS